jgi:hypothetical protein
MSYTGRPAVIRSFMTDSTRRARDIAAIPQRRSGEGRERRRTRLQAPTQMRIVRVHEEGCFDADRLASILVSILNERGSSPCIPVCQERPM